MKFEYDIQKSLSNKQKHDIDFEEAELLWSDEKMVEIKTSYEDEPRFVTIGKITAKVYAVMTIYRRENIRIISARRARKKEIEIYESPRI